MEFTDVVRRRRMVRAFTDEPVDQAARERVIANALHAPSAGFSQGWAFLVVEEAADRQRFWAATGGDDDEPDRWLAGMRAAPLLVVPLSCKDVYLDRYAQPDKGWADRDETRWPVPYWDIDTGMATLLMLLTVVDEGLGACFFGIPPARIPVFRDAFGVPVAYTPLGAVAVGHRAPDAPSPSLKRGRRPVDEVVHRGTWGRHHAGAP